MPTFFRASALPPAASCRVSDADSLNGREAGGGLVLRLLGERRGLHARVQLVDRGGQLGALTLEVGRRSVLRCAGRRVARRRTRRRSRCADRRCCSLAQSLLDGFLGGGDGRGRVRAVLLRALEGALAGERQRSSTITSRMPTTISDAAHAGSTRARSDLDRVERPSRAGSRANTAADHEEARRPCRSWLRERARSLRLVELDLVAHDARQLAGDGRDEGADAGARLAGGVRGGAGAAGTARAGGWAGSWMLLRVRG